MRKLIIKLLEFFKLIPEKKIMNQPCYDKWGRFLGWFSRSMAVAVFIYCKDKDGIWHVLASERGKGTPDYQGYWNCVCGYVEFDTSIPYNASKEVHEEVGISVDEDDLRFIGFEDSVRANHQNVTFRYAVVYEDRTIDEFKFSHKWNEKDEVGEIKWIPLNEIDKYKWAFNHNKRIEEIAHQLGLI